MICRLAAAQVVIIHTGQIIMDQTVCVQHLNSTCYRERLIAVTARYPAKLKNEYRSNALAACIKAVAHSLKKSRQRHVVGTKVFCELCVYQCFVFF